LQIYNVPPKYQVEPSETRDLQSDYGYHGYFARFKMSGFATLCPSVGSIPTGGTMNNGATPTRVLVVSVTLPLPPPRRHNWGAVDEPDVG
jgi:hypothetical protein